MMMLTREVDVPQNLMPDSRLKDQLWQSGRVVRRKGVRLPNNRHRRAMPGSGELIAASQKRHPLRHSSSIAAAGVIVALLVSSPLAKGATKNNGSRSAPEILQWLGYLHKLELQASDAPAVQSAAAGVKAAQGALAAQSGNLDLNLRATYADYPNGLGSNATGTSTGTFTNLKQYGELRASWGVLGFLGRRPGRIASATAQLKAARADVDYTKRTSSLSLMNRSISVWVSHYQREALRNSLAELKSADRIFLELHRRPISSALEASVEQAKSEALQLTSKDYSELASLPSPDKTLPPPPADYWALPPEPPIKSAVGKTAQDDLLAKELGYESTAFKKKTRAYWAKGFHLKLYGGYVRESLRNQAGANEGPEVGADFIIPIGTAGGGERENAYWQGQQKKLAAQAEIEKRKQVLRQVRQEWFQTAANLRSQRQLIRYQDRQLHYMIERAHGGASGTNAPEPWQVHLAEAQFWASVADAWQARGHWIQLVLAWSLYDGGTYLRSNPPPAATSAPTGLCAPLAACPSA